MLQGPASNTTPHPDAVIENEFGAISIDETLVKENLKVAEEVISLDNGCACCTVRGDLMKALTQLKDRKKDFDMVSTKRPLLQGCKYEIAAPTYLLPP